VILLEWLETRTPAPPPRLLERIVEVVGPSAKAPASAAVLLAAAEGLLRDLTIQPALGRASALDLLTVDALVTYAFEFAAESPESFWDTTTEAIGRLSAVAQ
jgi:hypothetical protein